MKFTSEDLLKAMGLKVKDKIYFKHYVYEILDNDYTDCLYRGNGVFSEFLPLTVLFNEEYTIIQPKPTLTEDEKVILRNLPKEYKWICRLYDGDLYITDVKPETVTSQWGFAKCNYSKSLLFRDLFQFIKWEDEPYSIEELLKE